MAGPGLALLAAGALGFAATDAPRLRYATLPEHRREILERSGPIDVLVLGTSRSHRGVSAKALGARLPGEGGAPPVVVNLGRPFRGDGQIHRMLRDLLERRPVRRVVLYELTHHPDRESYYHYYGINEIAVTFRDLVGDAASKPREPALSRLRDLLDQLLERADKSATLLLTGAYRSASRLPREVAQPQTKGVRRPGWEKTGRILQKREREVRKAHGGWDRAPAHRWDLHGVNEDGVNFYLQRTIALCRERGVRLVFYSIPRYLEAPLHEGLRRDFEETFGLPLLLPPPGGDGRALPGGVPGPRPPQRPGPRPDHGLGWPLTKPSPEMRKAIYEAEVGDDVFKEDPTVNKLEEYIAELLGKEAALYVPSGLMGNQICLNILTDPGDEVICDREAHIFNYESSSPARLSGIQLYPLDGKLGVLTSEQVEPYIRTTAYHMPRTKVIEVENTHNRAGGTIWPIENIIALKNLEKKHNLYFHLDGARIWNACVETGASPNEYAQHFDTISCCFSKGFGAPIGSAIAGSKEFIQEAYRVRKAWGGGMRQVGIIAAAALYAVQNNRERLKEDHWRAKHLAERIKLNPNLEINMEAGQTNILLFKSLTMTPVEGLKRCKEKGLILTPGTIDSIRAVTHLDVNDDDIENAANILDEVFS